uniref:Uncharacterized protein n=1 Tax=Rhizophora mucronata TaxID=61149 RepID=A0A2P2Q3W8_RHIMU
MFQAGTGIVLYFAVCFLPISFINLIGSGCFASGGQCFTNSWNYECNQIVYARQSEVLIVLSFNVFLISISLERYQAVMFLPIA